MYRASRSSSPAIVPRRGKLGNKAEELAGDPDELLAEYHRLEAEARATRDEHKRLLAAALERES